MWILASFTAALRLGSFTCKMGVGEWALLPCGILVATDQDNTYNRLTWLSTVESGPRQGLLPSDVDEALF